MVENPALWRPAHRLRFKHLHDPYLCTAPVPLTNKQIVARPVLSRAYEQNEWVLRNASGTGTGDRETAASVGAALAGLKPSYVSGLIYLEHGTTVTPEMISDYQTIRTAVLAQSSSAKFDVEISINPTPTSPKVLLASAAALIAMMPMVNAQLHADGWWFHFYSPNPNTDSEAAAISYAHS